MLETKQLKIFKTIVDVGSITGAGEQLNLSQSAISQQVRTMEEELGVPLFVRIGRGARPTPTGDVVLQYARHVLEKMDELERMLADHSKGRAGVFRLGMPEPPCNYVLPPVLVEMKRRFPRIDARLTSGHTAATLARLAAGELDLALLPLPVEADRLRAVDVGRDELVAIVPPSHPFAQRPWAAAADFEDQPLVLYDRSSQITDLTLGFFLEEGVFPRIAVEVDQLEAVKTLVRAGLGVAVVPRWAAGRELAEETLAPVRLGPVGITRSWGLLYSEQQRQPATFRAIVALLAEMLPALFGDRPESTRLGVGEA